MIKKFFFNLILILLFTVIIIITTLSTVGIETDKFNKVITEKISHSKKIKLDLKTINFRLDIKQLSLFLEAKESKINYNNLSIPTKDIKVYLDFISLLKQNLKIKKINLVLEELDLIQLKKLSEFIKPSNFKSFLNNKVTNGNLISEVEIFFNKEGLTKNYIIKGEIKNLDVKFLNNLTLSKTNLDFFADREDILVKNFYGNLGNIEINDGDIKLNLSNGTKISSNFSTKINLDEKALNKYSKIFNKIKFFESLKQFKGNFSNNVSIDLDSTNKIKSYSYNISGQIDQSYFEFKNLIKHDLITEEIKKIYIKKTQIETYFKPKNFKLNGKGEYSFNNIDYLEFDFHNDSKPAFLNLDFNFDYKNEINLKLINYKKPKGVKANLSLNLDKKKDIFDFKKINFNENENYIKIKGLKMKKNKFLSFQEMKVKTANNNFFIKWDKKISIKGSNFDATNLPKFIDKKGDENEFNEINGKIEIDFSNIKVPFSEKLKDFRLIGEIQKGKFVKISSKGDFGENNFLDISMKNDKATNKRFVEIYSDLARPLLTEYSFFNGLSGGKLFFTSLIDGSKSNSKLKIENFKVINAPGLIKLLSLADLGGLADLAEGEGLSFDVLEIDLEKNKNFLKINEILALGSSVSVLMEGYQNETGLTSLKGTLVPAKTLNKLISKIPVIGNIVIPKEVGEGLFGISFKMKGPKNDIKTTINPIRTLTPRFIQKIIDKNK